MWQLLTVRCRYRLWVARIVTRMLMQKRWLDYFAAVSKLLNVH